MDTNLDLQISTDSGCAKLLQELQDQDIARGCIECGHTKLYVIKSRNFILECANQKCKKQKSLTAGTFFHGKKLPITTSFRLLLDILSGREISSSAHARELKVSPSTIWRWRHEIRLLVHNNFSFDSTVKVDRNLLTQVLFRRSIESPAVNSNERLRKFDKNHFHQRSSAEGRSVAESHRYVSRNFKGVSEKYSQLYFSEFRFIQKAKMHEKKSLLRIIVRAGPVSINDIVAYSSPQFVDLPVARLVS